MALGEKKEEKKELHYSSLVLFDRSPARLVLQRTINLFSILNSWIHVVVMMQFSWILGIEASSLFFARVYICVCVFVSVFLYV